MAQSLLRCTAYYIVILTVCVDQGDGRWREKDKETLKHDIELYRRLAEKVDREIEKFYDEYSEERIEDNDTDRIHFTRVSNLLNHKKGEKKEVIQGEKSNVSSNINSTSFNTRYNQKIKSQNIVLDTNELKKSRSDWPKFEEMLLEIGKKYDWKNDRWIKVRQKLKKNKLKILKKINENNSVVFHEKHNFSYRIVKLNRNKSRRSVVVAVSAVR